jgi:hypothetical protein
MVLPDRLSARMIRLTPFVKPFDGDAGTGCKVAHLKELFDGDLLLFELVVAPVGDCRAR